MFSLPALPYSFDSFSCLSSKSFDYHYGKHHLSYVNTLNLLIAGNDFFIGKSLLEVIRYSFANLHDPFFKKIFNNAAQHWNHSFFWNSISPFPSFPSSEFLVVLLASFPSFDAFALRFEEAGLAAFGSGWVWICFDTDSKLIEIFSTSNAETPIQFSSSKVPLLVCDVWEHAYYIDFFNNRKDFLKAIFTSFNWTFAEQNFKNI